MASRALAASLVLASLAGCGMFHVKEQQAKIAAFCGISGQVEAERQDKVPLVVILARQVGADPGKRESWEMADHFVLERPGQWQFFATAGTYGLVAFQDLSDDLKLQPNEPYLRLDHGRLITCKIGERHGEIALHIPAMGRSGETETIDIAAL